MEVKTRKKIRSSREIPQKVPQYVRLRLEMRFFKNFKTKNKLQALGYIVSSKFLISSKFEVVAAV